MAEVTVTVVRDGWWLPGRALTQGQTLALDATTAQALARQGIVRIVASNAGKTPQAANKTRRPKSAP